MTNTELKTETERLAAEIERLYYATNDARVLPRVRLRIWNARQTLQLAIHDLGFAPPIHGRLGEHDVRD